MQSLFLACYFCLQLITLNNHDQAATYCDQCLTGLVEKFHLPSELANEVEDLLSLKKSTTEIVSNNPALADAIATLIQQQIAAATGSPANQTSANETTATDVSVNDTRANETLTNELPDIETAINETLTNELPTTDTDNDSSDDTNTDDDTDTDTDDTDSDVETPQKPSSTAPVGSVVQGLMKPRNSGKFRSFLRVNEKLNVYESLKSKNGKYWATLNDHGELVVMTADGTILEKLGCPSDEISVERIMLFHQSNQVRFYKSWRLARASLNNYDCTSPYHCSENLRCYLNLDDDGILRFYSGDGVLEHDYTNHDSNSQDNGAQESSHQKHHKKTGYTGPSTLEINQRLTIGQSLVSENGEYKITLNHVGELETYDSDGKIIRNSGTCRNNFRFPYGDDWNILMSSDNTWHLYPNMQHDSVCVGGTRRGCHKFGGSKCHLKLDNDGILKMVDDKGNIVQSWYTNTLDSHK